MVVVYVTLLIVEVAVATLEVPVARVTRLPTCVNAFAIPVMLAAGAPIVASAIEGYQNVARPGKDALLVPPGDVGALRDALRRLLDDSALRDRLVASGRERAEQFSMRRLAERYLELYERALVPAG